MSSRTNPYDGTGYVTPDTPAGLYTSIPTLSAQLTDMRNNGIYFREIGGETDVLILQVENFAIVAYKSLSNQRLLQQFVARATSINGATKIRWVSRNLALTFSFEQALKAVGENVTVIDSTETSDISQLNQQLASRFLQVYKQS